MTQNPAHHSTLSSVDTEHVHRRPTSSRPSPHPTSSGATRLVAVRAIKRIHLNSKEMSGLQTPGSLCLQRAKSLWKGSDRTTQPFNATSHLREKLVRETEKEAEFTKLTVQSGAQQYECLHVRLSPPGAYASILPTYSRAPIPPAPANFSL